MTSDQPKRGRFYQPPEGESVPMTTIRRLTLYTADGEPTTATTSIPMNGDIGRAIVAAERLGTMVIGLHLPDEGQPELIVAQPIDWNGKLRTILAQQQEARRTGKPIITATQQRKNGAGTDKSSS